MAAPIGTLYAENLFLFSSMFRLYILNVQRFLYQLVGLASGYVFYR